MSRGSFETKFAAVCKGCGAFLPVGEPVLAYGRGKLYGRNCHDRTTHDGDSIRDGYELATAEQRSAIRAAAKAGAEAKVRQTGDLPWNDFAEQVNEGTPSSARKPSGWEQVEADRRARAEEVNENPIGHAPDVDVVNGY